MGYDGAGTHQLPQNGVKIFLESNQRNELFFQTMNYLFKEGINFEETSSQGIFSKEISLQEFAWQEFSLQ